MKIVYIDMDDTLCDFEGAFSKALEMNPTVQYPQSQYRFFANLLPIEGAIETVKRLINSDEYDPYILSAPSTKNPFSYVKSGNGSSSISDTIFAKSSSFVAKKGSSRETS